MTLTPAELYIDETSSTCVRYVLAVGDKRIWLTRAEATEAGHEAARARMVAWARQHGYAVHDVEGKVIAVGSTEALAQRA